MKKLIERPGYFGRAKDQKIADLNKKYGEGKWRLVWVGGGDTRYEFLAACRYFYERSYFEFLKERPAEVDYICTFGECYDNAISNIDCGLDYAKQEAYSTHIQDIAIRNVLHLLGRKFEGSLTNLLQIRSTDSNGYKYGPGNVPFARKEMIIAPSIKPSWAKDGSVEDFWQSNKHIEIDVDN